MLLSYTNRWFIKGLEIIGIDGSLILFLSKNQACNSLDLKSLKSQNQWFFKKIQIPRQHWYKVL